MYRISATSTSLAVISLALATIAGCPLFGGNTGPGDGGNGSDTTPTTIAGTWSGWVAQRIAMAENTLEYLRTLPGTQPVESQGKLAVTWGDVKDLKAQN